MGRRRTKVRHILGQMVRAGKKLEEARTILAGNSKPVKVSVRSGRILHTGFRHVVETTNA